MSPRGRLNLVMGLLVAGALGFGGWRWRQQAQEAAGPAQRAAHAARAESSANRGPAPGAAHQTRALSSAAPSVPSPLPPWGEPLGANLALLRQRADAGDGRASCRIGVELELCGQGLTRYCDGLDQSLRDQAGIYLRKAALAGHRDGLLRYAQGAFLRQGGSDQDQYRYLHDPVFEHWYREAVPMLQRALRAGDPLAAQLLADAHADDRTPLDALVPDDPVQAYSYRLLLSWLRGEPAPDAGALDARQRADAEHQAQRLYRESFGSRPIPGGVPRALTLQPDDPTAAPCQ